LGVNWKKLKSKDLIDFLRSLIGRTKGLIVIILKFDGKLGIWLNKSKTKDLTEKSTWLYGLKLTKLEVKLKGIEILVVN